MATLSKRATPVQQKMLRIVEGAVKNALDAHPEIVAPETFARSVAKRAVGTLSAVFADVLAASPKPSEQVGADNSFSAPPCPRCELRNGTAQARGPAHRASRSPLSDHVGGEGAN